MVAILRYQFWADYITDTAVFEFPTGTGGKRHEYWSDQAQQGPANPANDGSGGPDLSIQGSARAAALPALFAPASPELDCAIDGSDPSFTGTYSTQQLTGPEPRFDTPNFIIATADSTNSNRPRETATPTAMALGVPFDYTTYSDSTKSIAQLATDITNDTIYSGQVILICWHHGTIPTVARQLGVANPPPWDGSTVFDRVWVIDFTQTPLAVDDQPQ